MRHGIVDATEVYVDHASHQFDHSFAHHEADAGAFLGAALLSETVERLKKLRQLFRRQPRAGVLDADPNALRTGHGLARFTIRLATRKSRMATKFG